MKKKQLVLLFCFVFSCLILSLYSTCPLRYLLYQEHLNKAKRSSQMFAIGIHNHQKSPLRHGFWSTVWNSHRLNWDLGSDCVWDAGFPETEFSLRNAKYHQWISIKTERIKPTKPRCQDSTCFHLVMKYHPLYAGRRPASACAASLKTRWKGWLILERALSFHFHIQPHFPLKVQTCFCLLVYKKITIVLYNFSKV